MLSDSTSFFKSLADETRLAAVMMIYQHGELCVCELVEALALSQPKISRHLSQLRTQNVLSDNRRGQWVYYRLSDSLPDWAIEVIAQAAAANTKVLANYDKTLASMDNRPNQCD